jgi:hypothetical protein
VGDPPAALPAPDRQRSERTHFVLRLGGKLPPRTGESPVPPRLFRTIQALALPPFYRNPEVGRRHRRSAGFQPAVSPASSRPAAGDHGRVELSTAPQAGSPAIQQAGKPALRSRSKPASAFRFNRTLMPRRSGLLLPFRPRLCSHHGAHSTRGEKYEKSTDVIAGLRSIYFQSTKRAWAGNRSRRRA